MKVLYKISFNQYETEPQTCEVPDCKLTYHSDSMVTSTAHEIDAVEETLCDIVRNFIAVEWKLPEEPDIRYREAEFPEWSYVGELVERIEQLEKELANLRLNLG